MGSPNYWNVKIVYQSNPMTGTETAIERKGYEDGVLKVFKYLFSIMTERGNRVTIDYEKLKLFYEEITENFKQEMLR